MGLGFVMTLVGAIESLLLDGGRMVPARATRDA